MRERFRVAIPFFMEVLIVLYVFHTSLPIFGYYTPAAVHAIIVLLLYGMLIQYDNNFGNHIKSVIPIFIIYVLSFIYSGFDNFEYEFYGMLQILLFPLLSLYLMRNCSKKTLKRIIILICLSYFITAITTYIGNQIFPLASRTLATLGQDDETLMYDTYMKMNIGGFNFTYTLVLITPILMYMIRNKKIFFIIGVALIAIFSVVIVTTEYTTALLSFAMTVICLIFMRKKFGWKIVALILTGVILFVFVFDQYILPYLENFIGVFESEAIDTRLLELSKFTTNQASYEGDIGSRWELYNMSWESFYDSPIIGSSDAKVGGHSYVFDNLGKFGVVGLFGMIIMFRHINKSFYKPFKKSDIYGYVCFSLGLAIMLAILNPKDNIPVITFIIPILASYYFKQNKLT